MNCPTMRHSVPLHGVVAPTELFDSFDSPICSAELIDISHFPTDFSSAQKFTAGPSPNTLRTYQVLN